jgi:hypothetical protein
MIGIVVQFPEQPIMPFWIGVPIACVFGRHDIAPFCRWALRRAGVGYRSGPSHFKDSTEDAMAEAGPAMPAS